MYAVGPAALASGGVGDRFYALSPFQGLAFSDDESCTWKPAAGLAAGSTVSDFFVDPSDPTHVLAVAAAASDGGLAGAGAVFASTDGGATFGSDAALQGAAGATSSASRSRGAIRGSSTSPRTRRRRPAGAGAGALDRRGRELDDDAAEADGGAGDRAHPGRRSAGQRPGLPARDRAGRRRGRGRAKRRRHASRSRSRSRAGSSARSRGWAAARAGRRADRHRRGRHRRNRRAVDRRRGVVPALDDLPAPAHLVGLAERIENGRPRLYLSGKNYSDGWALAVSDDEGATLTTLMTYDQVKGMKACVRQICAGHVQLREHAGHLGSVGLRVARPGAARRGGSGGVARDPGAGAGSTRAPRARRASPTPRRSRFCACWRSPGCAVVDDEFSTEIASTALGAQCRFRSSLYTAFPYKAGPIAQRSELAAHNRLVPGSNPGGPTLDLPDGVEGHTSYGG